MIKYKTLAYLMIGLIVVALASSLWLIFKKQIPTTSTQTANQPDSFAIGIKAVRYNKKGDIAVILTAPSLSHYPLSNMTVFQKPKILLYNKKQNPWVITSDTGIAQNNFNFIVLNGNVLLHQPAGVNNPEYSIKTNELNININEQTAYTQDLITLYQKAKNHSTTIVHSKGLKANEKTGDISLLANVRGYYVPAK